MCKTRKGLRIVKNDRNDNINAKVSITRKTIKSGDIKYAVVLTGRNGVHTRLKSFDNIMGAWGLYKQMMAV